jgi:hypothetical protein
MLPNKKKWQLLTLWFSKGPKEYLPERSRKRRSRKVRCKDSTIWLIMKIHKTKTKWTSRKLKLCIFCCNRIVKISIIKIAKFKIDLVKVMKMMACKINNYILNQPKTKNLKIVRTIRKTSLHKKNNQPQNKNKMQKKISSKMLCAR